MERTLTEPTRVKPTAQVLASILGVLCAGVTLATLFGLGLHREASSLAVAAAATGLVLVPPLALAVAVKNHRVEVLGLAASLWSVAVFLALPIYFPGERADAMVTGLSLGSSDIEPMARALAGAMPEEPRVAEPEAPVAETLVVQPIPEPKAPLLEHQIALPYEGDGRRLSVEIAVEHGGETRELQFLLDTGATYTTMPSELLAKMGIRPSEDDPVITLHTANGTREARIVLLDRVWLGDLPMDGVAVATCDPCAGEDTVGLLGLNVTGGFNLTIDADRREVVFSRRADYSRHLDVKPFVDVGATISRLPGRVSVEARLDNRAHRPVTSAQASIHCREETWLVDLGEVGPGELGTASRRLPPHEPCERYQVGLHAASW